MTFTPHREGRWEYATQTVEHVEANNCVKGCKVPTINDIQEYGPGGCCPVLAAVGLGDEDVPELDDDGKILTCNARVPL